MSYDLESAKREAWQGESLFYAAIIAGCLLGSALIIAGDERGFQNDPTWAKILWFVVIAWVLAIPVLIATAILARVVSAVRRWDAARKGIETPR